MNPPMLDTQTLTHLIGALSRHERKGKPPLDEVIEVNEARLLKNATHYRREHGKYHLSALCYYEARRRWFVSIRREETQHPGIVALDRFVDRYCEVVPFTREAALEAARLWAALRDRCEAGQLQSSLFEELQRGDLLLAASAIAEGCPFVTTNLEHFSHISAVERRLRVVNWLES
jgi:predicted nucleic acid-binding protein